jgi:hypothetical protein
VFPFSPTSPHARWLGAGLWGLQIDRVAIGTISRTSVLESPVSASLTQV